MKSSGSAKFMNIHNRQGNKSMELKRLIAAR